MLFRDRNDAGKQLADALAHYQSLANTLVIALPRGGVVVGYQIATLLHLPLDIVSPRKIGAPFNPEFAIGAITETGDSILSEDLLSGMAISEDYLKKTMQEEKEKAQWRLDHYRKGRPPRALQNRTVLLVDDGLATGSTMHAAIKTVKREQAQKIVVAVPVAPADTLLAISREVNEVICLSTPSPFYAVGQFYEHFEQTEDAEVIALLEKSFSSTFFS